LTAKAGRAQKRPEGLMNLPFSRSLALSLALCAMLLRALLPAGWMPNPAAEGSPFVVCSVDGAHVPGKPAGDPAQERGHAPCAFAAVAHLAPPASGPVAVAAPSYIGIFTVARADASAGVSFVHRPQSARAPPSVS
jgi:hypothetical protein